MFEEGSDWPGSTSTYLDRKVDDLWYKTFMRTEHSKN